MLDKPHEECGVFGIFNMNDRNIAQDIYLALFALQHRGQLSCGMTVDYGNGDVETVKNTGIVPEVFDADTLAKFSKKGIGISGIGHVRYSSKEFAGSINNQPLTLRYAKGTAAIANNGGLVNAGLLREKLSDEGAIFQTGSDAEIIGTLAAGYRLSEDDMESAIEKTMYEIEGAYSFVMFSPGKLIAVRDPHGFRPLCLGKIEDSYIVASESCAITGIGGTFIRDIEPGEILVIDKEGTHSIRTHCGQKSSLCIFEHVYFARPDSVIDGAGVHIARKRAGAFLAKQSPVDADVVVGVPDSGIDAAIGYADESGIPFETGFIKNRYVGRTFIKHTQAQRERAVHIKLNPIRSAVEGKRIVLIDDSIVRGTTSSHIVELLRSAGAKEVHMRISSPPFLNPCYFGTDISSREYLIACNLSQKEICQKIGADSLAYLSVENLHEIAKESKCGFCDACFTGNYPVNCECGDKDDKFASKLKSLK